MPAARLLLVDPTRISDLATFSASSYDPSLPPANLKDTRLDAAWQSIGSASAWVKMDWGQGRSFNAAFFVGHNLSIGATVKIEGSNDDAIWTTIVDTRDVYDSYTGFGQGGFGRGGFGGKSPDGGQFNDLDHMFLVEFDIQSWQYVRFTFTDPTNPDGHIRIGRLAADLGILFGDYDWDYRIALNDPSNVAYSAGGQPLADDQALFYMFDFNFNWTRVDFYWSKIDPVLRRLGRKKDLALGMDQRDDAPTWAQQARFYGRFEPLPSFDSAQQLGSVKVRFRQSR